MGVGHPAHALVALVAVGGDAVQIGPRSPQDALLDVVQDLFGSGEGAGLPHRRMDDAAADAVERRRARIAGHLHVAEAVIGEARLPDLAVRVAFQDVVVGGFGPAQVLGVQRAVLIDELGVAEADLRAPGSLDAQLDPAADVLPQVEDPDAGLRVQEPPGIERLDHLDRRHHLRRELPAGARYDLGGLPAAVVEARTVPAGRLPGGVVGLAVVDAVGQDRPLSRFPGAVGDHPHRAAALQLHHELQQRLALAVPALAEDQPDGVRARPQQAGDVVGDVEDALVVGGPAGVEHVVADLAAVDPQLVVAEAGDVGPGAHRRGVEAELLAELIAAGDPLSRPVARLEQSHLEPRRTAVRAGLAILVPPADLPLVGGAGGERRAAVTDADRVRRFHLPGIPDGAPAGRDDDLVGRLALVPPVLRQRPGEARLAGVDSQRVLQMLHAERDGRRRRGGAEGAGNDERERNDDASGHDFHLQEHHLISQQSRGCLRRCSEGAAARLVSVPERPSLAAQITPAPRGHSPSRNSISSTFPTVSSSGSTRERNRTRTGAGFCSPQVRATWLEPALRTMTFRGS